MNQKSHMYSGTTCKRCKVEAKDSTYTVEHVKKLQSKEKESTAAAIDFINSPPEERLTQVQKHGFCMIYLLRDHASDAHLARATTGAEMLQGC